MSPHIYLAALLLAGLGTACCFYFKLDGAFEGES